MKIALSLGIVALAVLLVFQNCNHGPNKNREQLQVGSMLSVNSKQDLKQKNLNSIVFYINDVQTVQKSNNTFQLKYEKILALDLISGAIEETSDLKAEVSTYCLPLGWRNEINLLLKSSEICHYKPDLLPETVCAQVMRNPYAEIITDKETISLGSASDSCGSNAVDICDAGSAELKDYIIRLNAAYSQMSCD